MTYTVRLAKDNFKFSGSHFTIFGDGIAERLHGHNYYVTVAIQFKELDKKTGLAFDFNSVKPVIKELCDSLDEKVLLPKNSPFLEISQKGSQVDVSFSKKHYSLPKEDVAILDLVNISSEELSRHLASKLKQAWPLFSKMQSLAVSVEETRGQSAECRIDT